MSNSSGLFSSPFRNNTASSNSSGSNSSGLLQQALFGGAVVVLVYIILFTTELLYQYFNRLHMNRTELLPYTYNVDDKTITISQNPNVRDSKPTSLSDNEPSGVEFSYSFYLYVHPSGFRTEEGLHHLFHKGYSKPFPLMGPGVFMRSDTNTLRVYMNTFKTWNNYIEVRNIPVGKWVHLAIICKNSALEIFINGNLSSKMSFDGYAPYQNYQDIVCFSQRKIKILAESSAGSSSATATPATPPKIDIFGAMKGMMSRLTYFNYALAYTEIQTLMNEGPSSEMDSTMMNDVPPYLADTWWSQK